ncbi:MAG: hypothetical protein ACYSRQ_00850 [Planctomycetota bacterium]
MKQKVFFLLLTLVFFSGCMNLRFAPSEEQKKNAWLHSRTAIAAAEVAKEKDVSTELQQLTELSKFQSKSFVSYFGLPKELPASDSVEEILAQSSWKLADTALIQSNDRPDIWELTDSTLEFGIAIAALFGGIYGTRAIGFLKEAKNKSKALKEIIEGNELFKKSQPEQASSFKDSHKKQSASTRQIVTTNKF